jgi:hypothetical protein
MMTVEYFGHFCCHRKQIMHLRMILYFESPVGHGENNDKRFNQIRFTRHCHLPSTHHAAHSGCWLTTDILITAVSDWPKQDPIATMDCALAKGTLAISPLTMAALVTVAASFPLF